MTDGAGSRLEDEGFYEGLAPLTHFQDVTDPDLYADAPRSWVMVVTDVIGSTQAIEEGRYRDVNALGVACIIAVRNALTDLQIPFVFGGDGATLLVPGSRLASTEAALRGTRQMARDALGLDLRTSVVALSELYEAGLEARVARFKAAPHVTLAMFWGRAFPAAEAWVKHPERGAAYAVSAQGDDAVNFEGFECRWKPVRARRGNTVSLLVLALSDDDRAQTSTYRRVLSALQEIAGDDARPVASDNLILKGLGGDFSTEAKVRASAASGAVYRAAFASARKAAVVGKTLSALGMRAGAFDGARYKAEVQANTDFRKFDGTLRMVLDLSLAQLDSLRTALEAERSLGSIAYGMHRADSAVITCLVESYQGDHLHFVDGADGGYALAAKQLKAQLATRH